MTEFKALSLDEVCKKIYNVKNPVIAIHRSPDGDAVGSAVGLFYIFRELGVRAYCICADKIPERLEFMSGCFEGEPTLPYSECEIIALDIAAPGQLGKLPERIPEASAPYMMIDHHARGEAFADNYIRPDACATGEIIFDIAEKMTELGMISALPKEAASALYAAISSDSGCFKYSNAKPHTHAAAAKLLQLGVDSAEINRLLFDSKSESVLRAEGFALAKMTPYFDGKVNAVVITKAEREALGLEFEHFETSIDIVRSLQNVKIAIAVKQQDDGVYKVSMRSSGADVASVCAEFGGGGHIRAAGCSIEADSADEMMNTLWRAVERVL